MLKPALLYFALTFAAGFMLGALRMFLIAPRIGAVAAVLIECPFILLASYFIARRILGHFAPNAVASRRLLMGLIAFAMLMTAELLMSWAQGISPQEFSNSLFKTAGAIGLAGQILFAFIPLLIRPPTLPSR